MVTASALVSALGFDLSGCDDQDCFLNPLRERQRGTLQIVLGINAVLFFVIVVSALYGNSSALLADSLDNLGDALTYGLSLLRFHEVLLLRPKLLCSKVGLFFSPLLQLWRKSFIGLLLT